MSTVKQIRNNSSLKSIIKINRLVGTVSKKKLCKNICTLDELSAIESGDEKPTISVLSKLLKRLSLNVTNNETQPVVDLNEIIDFNERFLFNEFDVTNKRFIDMQDREVDFVVSSYVLDYYIAKLSFYSVQDRRIYGKLKDALSTMTDHMNDIQKYYYYLCLGIDQLKVMKDLKMANIYLKMAKDIKYSGEVCYWYAYMQLIQRRPIEAVKYAEKAIAKYVEDANIVGVISSFELKGLIYYSVSEYTSGILQYNKALSYTSITVNEPYKANINNQIAWGYLRLGDYDKAQQHIQKDRYNSDLTVNASVTKFLIALNLKSSVMLDALKNEFRYRNRSLHRMIYSLLQKEQYFDANDNWLIEDDELDALFEFAQFTHFELEKVFAEIAAAIYVNKQQYDRAYHYYSILVKQINHSASNQVV